jgi:hypothetical protein
MHLSNAKVHTIITVCAGKVVSLTAHEKEMSYGPMQASGTLGDISALCPPLMIPTAIAQRSDIYIILPSREDLNLKYVLVVLVDSISS